MGCVSNLAPCVRPFLGSVAAASCKAWPGELPPGNYMGKTVRTITTTADNEAKLAEWLRERGGIAVWSNKDLGSPSLGGQQFTPATHKDGSPATSPHWSCGHAADFVVTDPAAVTIQEWREVSRVKIRNGPPYLGCVHRLDRDRLDKALAAAGDGATYRRDYSAMKYGSPWFDAVIEVPASVRPLNINA